MGGLVSSVFGGDNQGAQFQAAAAPIASIGGSGQSAALWGDLNGNPTNVQGQGGQGALAQQQSFINALQGQNGIGNQSSVYNQLAQVAAGQGPNPAQAMLNQSTGANVANQAALMAGQRGSGANAGLIARQAAQQGGSLQQQAAGQAATMQANQSLGALNTMGGIAGQQVGQQGGALQNYNNNLLGQQQNVNQATQITNQANVGSTSSQNQANEGSANTVTQGQQGLFGSILGAPAKLLGGLAHGGEVKKMADGGPTLGQSFEMTPTQFSPATSAASMPTVAPIAAPPTNGPQSGVGQFFKGVSEGMTPAQGSNNGANQAAAGSSALISGLASLGAQGINAIGNALSSSSPTQVAGGTGDAISSTPDTSNSQTMVAAKGGKVPVMLSPGEAYIPPQNVKAAAEGADPKQVGKIVPGKAKVKGDSLKNDTYKTELDSGGMVIPRSIMDSSDAANKAAAFVRAHLSKKGSLPKKA